YNETFPCSANAADYTNGSFTDTHPNTATATGPNTNLSDSATVTVNCVRPETWKGETATGAGNTYPGSSNWFMFTPYTTQKVDLIAGQHYDAGDIYMSRANNQTTIRIELHDGFRWANVKENLKIQDFSTAPTSPFSAGKSKYKFTVDPSQRTVTVVIPGTKATHYGIHADVQRLVN
ncbi:MAG TPA: hypothetical protein VM287_02295, partial [Egibacteraceae bacterium]|nr:hypothetical protein [Egibacteraceae bacterium]